VLAMEGLGSATPARIVATLSISIRLFANLFPGTLSRQSLLYSALIARLQVEGVTLHFLDDVLGLNFAFESTKSILNRFALLQSNFCHAHHPQRRRIGQLRGYSIFAAFCRSMRNNTEKRESVFSPRAPNGPNNQSVTSVMKL
jgi:hypothetical protein